MVLEQKNHAIRGYKESLFRLSVHHVQGDREARESAHLPAQPGRYDLADLEGTAKGFFFECLERQRFEDGAPPGVYTADYDALRVEHINQHGKPPTQVERRRLKHFTGERVAADRRLGDLLGCDAGQVIPCRTVQRARPRLQPLLGQRPREEFLSLIDGLELEWGQIKINPETGQTTNPKYFAAGDAINGGATVVQAVGGAKVAVAGIEAFLQGEKR